MSEIVERGEPAGLDFDRLDRDDFLRAVRLAHLLTGSNDAAEDIAQEAFPRVRTVRTEIRDPQAYLTTTVVRLCRNWQRGRRRRIAREQRRAGDVSAFKTSHGEVDHHEELLALVDRLPFRQRTVLVARYWLDLPEADGLPSTVHAAAVTRCLAPRNRRARSGDGQDPTRRHRYSGGELRARRGE